MAKFDYFQKDGAVFRRAIRAEFTDPMVDHVKIKGEWKPYKGDRAAPVYFGDEITAAEAGETA